MKLIGANAVFCFKTQIDIGGTQIVGIATGTAFCLRALPIPKPL